MFIYVYRHLGGSIVIGIGDDVDKVKVKVNQNNHKYWDGNADDVVLF